jgi:hypothetical protein
MLNRYVGYRADILMEPMKAAMGIIMKLYRYGRNTIAEDFLKGALDFGFKAHYWVSDKKFNRLLIENLGM